MTWEEWQAAVQAAGGVATAWPFKDRYQGQPAAKFTAAQYVVAYNAGMLPASGTQATADNQTVYVLAQAMTGSMEVVETAPHTMTMSEAAANAVFTGLDAGADAVGLPSLAGIESFLTGVGRDILVGIAVTVAVAYFLKRRR